LARNVQEISISFSAVTDTWRFRVSSAFSFPLVLEAIAKPFHPAYLTAILREALNLVQP
jgi:hypothetical protein